MKTRHNIAIGDIMAEQIKINVGSALTELDDPPPNYAVHGRDLMSGIPKEIIVTYKEIAGALNNSIEQIEEAVMGALFQTPPALSAGSCPLVSAHRARLRSFAWRFGVPARMTIGPCIKAMIANAACKA